MSVPRILELDEIPADALLPTEYGEFRIRVFQDHDTGLDHVALLLGNMSGPDPVLIRVHSECLTGDAFNSLRCDCGAQLGTALRLIQETGWGCLVYLRQEGRGIGLHAKIQAYNLQDRGVDTMEANLMLGHPADARDYGVASEILKSMGIERVCLLTNNPDKVDQLTKHGINVVERMGLVAGVSENNVEYLSTKAQKMGHQIDEGHLNGS
ncbi:MAG: GTP cyclohydrolase II [Candidatus Thalassarchaeaceae archaeon]|jgi:GTP cyclohydrolase II|nr:GTP cyclohydrolase II [Candidatus Thalassarchaeaceae archaeon]